LAIGGLSVEITTIMIVIHAIRKRVKNFIRGRIQKWGWAGLKQRLWDWEFSKGRWDFIDKTPEDPVYQYVVKYCKQGSILDLGCGSGNTGCELDAGAYRDYTGVDISEVALAKARQRSAEIQRAGKNRYFQSDILTYVPDRSYDVILLRESIYYIPKGRITGMMERYSGCLKPDGVFIVSWYEGKASQEISETIGSRYRILEQRLLSPSGPVIIVFSRK
jgi:2-polyprenyl-6-hydroxyphenyl methylase/3-demethylubiquinone-9 3-methyltransferase